MRVPTYGVCAGCGAVAWELLTDRSDCCLDCDPSAYRDDDDEPGYAEGSCSEDPDFRCDGTCSECEVNQ